MRDYEMAGKGLQMIFIGQIIGFFKWIPIPLLSSVFMFLGLALLAIGLYIAGKGESDYNIAFMLSFVYIVVSLITKSGSFLAQINSILLLIIIRNICNTSADLLYSIGEDVWADRGIWVWKIYLYCLVVLFACGILVFIFPLRPILVILFVCFVVSGPICSIMFITFLYNAQNLLQFN